MNAASGVPDFDVLSIEEINTLLKNCRATDRAVGVTDKEELVTLCRRVGKEMRFTCAQFLCVHRVLALKGRSRKEVLGIQREAEAASAFRNLARQLHPDKCGYPLQVEAFKILGFLNFQLSSSAASMPANAPREPIRMQEVLHSFFFQSPSPSMQSVLAKLNSHMSRPSPPATLTKLVLPLMETYSPSGPADLQALHGRDEFIRRVIAESTTLDWAFAALEKLEIECFVVNNAVTVTKCYSLKSIVPIKGKMAELVASTQAQPTDWEDWLVETKKVLPVEVLFPKSNLSTPGGRSFKPGLTHEHVLHSIVIYPKCEDWTGLYRRAVEMGALSKLAELAVQHNVVALVARLMATDGIIWPLGGVRGLIETNVGEAAVEAIVDYYACQCTPLNSALIQDLLPFLTVKVSTTLLHRIERISSYADQVPLLFAMRRKLAETAELKKHALGLVLSPLASFSSVLLEDDALVQVVGIVFDVSKESGVDREGVETLFHATKSLLRNASRTNHANDSGITYVIRKLLKEMGRDALPLLELHLNRAKSTCKISGLIGQAKDMGLYNASLRNCFREALSRLGASKALDVEDFIFGSKEFPSLSTLLAKSSSNWSPDALAGVAFNAKIAEDHLPAALKGLFECVSFDTLIMCGEELVHASKSRGAHLLRCSIGFKALKDRLVQIIRPVDMPSGYVSAASLNLGGLPKKISAFLLDTSEADSKQFYFNSFSERENAVTSVHRLGCNVAVVERLASHNPGEWGIVLVKSFGAYERNVQRTRKLRALLDTVRDRIEIVERAVFEARMKRAEPGLELDRGKRVRVTMLMQ